MARYVPEGEESALSPQEEHFCHDIRRDVKPSHIVVGAGISLAVSIAAIIACAFVYARTGGTIPFDYGVVVDAGSTHTQAVLYNWVGSKENGTGEVIQQAECTYSPGITSLSDPAAIVDCVANITMLISKAVMPRSPLYFGGTGGMRLMNITQPEIVHLILLYIKCGLEKLGVDVKEVNVISGFEEGIYSWITVNFLEKTLHPNNENHFEETYGSLDMGGASTQVSFAVDSVSNNSDTIHLKLYGHNYTVFSTSFLCFGANEAHNRHQALLIKNLTVSEFIDPCLPEGNVTVINAEKLLGEPCVITEAFEEWLQHDRSNRAKNFTFIGSSNYEECKHHVKSLIDPDECKKEGFKTCAEKIIIPNKNMKFLAFSSFYYVTNFLNATNASLMEYENITENWCSLTWQNIVNHSFDNKIFKHLAQYCFGAVFTAEWLTNVYGFDEKLWKNIFFQEKVAKTDLGWALGLMINATNAVPAEKPSPPVLSKVVFTVIILCCGFIVMLSILLIRGYFKEMWMNPQRVRLRNE